MIILGIESSCDETAVSICKGGKILSNIVSSQQIHNDYGGVVPEVAAREHDRLLNHLIIKSLDEANISLNDLNGIGVTKGPGLAGTLLTGVSFAKGLSQSINIPIIGINHLEAHIYANFLAYPKLKYPLVCLLVSGGHTQIWYIKNIFDYELLGDTRDDAAGEAFDKGARVLGLGYPGGPIIEKISLKGSSNAINFPRALMEKDNLEFSFSGVKTSLLYLVNKEKSFDLEDIAASYQNKGLEFHDELFSIKGSINQEKLEQVVNKVGLDILKLRIDITKDEIKNIVRLSSFLANGAGARGTPTIFVNDEFVPGYISYQRITSLLK